MKKNVAKFIKNNWKWMLLFICLIGFLALAEDVFNKEIMNGDIIGYKIISTFLISDFATPIAKSQHMREIWFYVMSGGVMLKIVVMEIARIIQMF